MVNLAKVAEAKDIGGGLIDNGQTVKAKIVKIEDKNDKNGNLGLLFELQVCEGQFEGSKLTDWLTISGEWAYIGESKLKVIMDTALNCWEDGNYNYDHKELINKFAICVVRQELYNKDDGSQGVSNKIDKYGSANPESNVHNIVEAYGNNEQRFKRPNLQPKAQAANTSQQPSYNSVSNGSAEMPAHVNDRPAY